MHAIVEPVKKSSRDKKHSSERRNKKKKGKKKKSDKEKKSDRERRKSKKPDRESYQAIPAEAGEPESKEESTNKNQAQHREIPESLTGREISWGQSFLEDTEVIPFVEDLHKAPKENATRRRRHRPRRPSRGEAPVPTQEIMLDASDEQQKKEERSKQILLDRNGFPIEDDDSIHSLHVQEFSRPTSGSVPKLNDSYASTE